MFAGYIQKNYQHIYYQGVWILMIGITRKLAHDFVASLISLALEAIQY